jgi:hypothetical protein
MAGFFLVQTRDPDFAEAALAAARDQFVLHGFSQGTEIGFPGWRLMHAPHILGGPESVLVEGEDFAAVAGTLVCDGKMGRPALEALLREVALPAPDWSRLGGQFVALVRRGGRAFLFTDYFGAFQLFHDADLRLFSTSFLAAARALPKLSFDSQSVYEFAFNVVPLGDSSLFAELGTLGPDRAVELGEAGATVHFLAKPLPDEATQASLEDRIAVHREHLFAIVRHHVEAFGDRVFCPLSGGLDSRLLLAALRAEGCTPEIYVYGPENSADVRIAREIGKTQGFAVEWRDKEAFRSLEPDEYPEQVARNFHQYDALPNYGELFENGGNAAARDARHAGGALSASGGCGEIYRNFFFSPDRPIRAATIARTFFARYALGDVSEAFDESAFLRGVEDKILAALGLAGARGPISRAMIEQIYPRVRCRSLFGREISLEGRHGAYLMPFLDHRVVAEAMTLPVALKNAGRFEAALLNAIDPALAVLPSAYGHDFAGQPSIVHRFGEWSTRIRPAWVRRKSYALQRRLRPMADEHGGLLTPDYMGRVVDLEFPAMRRYFRPEAITDSGMMRRIACLEYLAAQMGSRLAG